MIRQILFSVAMIVVILSMSGFRLAAEDAAHVMLCNFDDPADIKKINPGDSGNVELSVGPRSPTEMNNVLKLVVLGGNYPGIAIKAPKDWSAYDTLSFVVWAPAPMSLAVRIDDENSRNYATRYNKDGLNVDKGRSLIQISVREVARTLDVTKIRYLIIFMGKQPKGLTLYFDDIQLGPAQSMDVPFIPYDQRYDCQPSMEVVTPHLPMAKNLAGGPLAAFMLTGVQFGREVIEMMQRMDYTVSQMCWDREWDVNTWGMGDCYGKRGHKFDYNLMQKYITSSMQGPERFEVMVLSTPMGWNRFTTAARAAIIKRVKEDGEGLVLVMPFPGEKGKAWPDDLKALSPLINSESDYLSNGGWMHYANEGRRKGKTWKKTVQHPITAGVPLDALPFSGMEYQKYAVAPDASVLIESELGDPILAVKQFGKGRVVAFSVRAMNLTPVFSVKNDRNGKWNYRYWEVWYDLINRAAYWASGRKFQRDGDPITTTVDADDADPFFTLLQWKNDAGKVTDWELVFSKKAPDYSVLAVTAPDTVDAGKPISATVVIPPELIDAQWTAVLREESFGKWRTLERITLTPVADGNAPVSFTVPMKTNRMRWYNASIRVQAVKDGQRVAFGEAETLVAPDPVWDDYEALCWGGTGLPFLNDFERQRMREFGLTGSSGMKRDLLRAGLHCNALGYARGLHADNYETAVRQYKITGDRKYLIRVPSLTDPDWLKKETARLLKVGKTASVFKPFQMIASDETSYTSYGAPFDFDFHPSNIARFRDAMAAKFKTIGALNAALGTTFDSFDVIEPPTTDAARAGGNWGLWNEWRAHNDNVWTDQFKLIRDTLLKNYPAARMSVSGTQTSTPFNGIDWAKLAPLFDAMCPYSGRYQIEKRMAFHPGIKNTPWGGYGATGRAVDYQVWSNLVKDGAGMALFWWYSLRNPDLSFSKSGKSYQRVFRDMRAGIGKQYQLARREFSPVAVLWSATSQRAAYTEGKFDDFVKTEAKVMNTLIAAGFDPSFVSDTTLSADALAKRGVKILVLPMTLAVGVGEKAGGVSVLPELKKFMDADGVIIATDAVRYDEFLQPLTPPPAFAQHENKVMFDTIEDAVSAFMAEHGVRSYVPLTRADGAPVKKITAVVHKLNGGSGARIVTLLRPSVGYKTIIGADGVPHSVPDKTGGAVLEPITLDVSAFKGMTYYDSRNEKRLDSAADGTLTIAMRAGDGRPFAFLPYTVAGLQANGVVSDRMLRVSWKLLINGNARVAPHVVRITVTHSGSDVVLPALSRNAVTMPDGTGSVQIPLAFEDVSLPLTVRLRDVLTGVKTTVSVQAAE